MKYHITVNGKSLCKSGLMKLARSCDYATKKEAEEAADKLRELRPDNVIKVVRKRCPWA
mgnify:CR=1 FL=1